MKKSILTLQIIIGALFILIALPFNGCEPDCEPDYQECDTCGPVLYKPNIYLYPAERSHLSVSLRFPQGGKIITSIPAYENGWTIDVDTSGIINDTYGFLFYESKQPDIWQLNEGWIIKQSDLESFFKENMLKHGFYGREISDFIEYWIPRLKDFEYYEIYPQESGTIEKAIMLDISKMPGNVLRLYYLIKGVKSSSNDKLIIPDEGPEFSRRGFYVTEWGVLLK